MFGIWGQGGQVHTPTYTKAHTYTKTQGLEEKKPDLPNLSKTAPAQIQAGALIKALNRASLTV